MAKDTTKGKKAQAGTSKAVIKRQSQAKLVQLVYVGPNLAGDLHIAQFTVYRNDLPAPIKTAIKADAVLGRLFVPVTQLAQARTELTKASSVLTQAAQHTYKKYRLGVSQASLPGGTK